MATAAAHQQASTCFCSTLLASVAGEAGNDSAMRRTAPLPAAAPSPSAAPPALRLPLPPPAPPRRRRPQRLLGCALVCASALWFCATWFALFGAKLLPAPAPAALAARGAAGAVARALAFAREDWHYASLLPLVVAAWLVFVYANWLAFKYFKHN